MCWPSVRSEASGAGDSDQPATALYASVPPARVPQRDRVMAMRLGRVEWHEVLSNTVLDRLQTTIVALIVCHSIRPGQVRTMVAGRLIWHRTTGYRAAILSTAYGSMRRDRTSLLARLRRPSWS